MTHRTDMNEKTPAHNRRLAQWRVKWLIEHSTSYQLLCWVDSLVLQNRQLLEVDNRYWLYKIL
jgi:hypothetical protein